MLLKYIDLYLFLNVFILKDNFNNKDINFIY